MKTQGIRYNNIQARCIRSQTRTLSQQSAKAVALTRAECTRVELSNLLIAVTTVLLLIIVGLN